MRLFLRRIIIIFMVCSVYVLISTSFVVINTTAISFPQTSMGKAILSDQLGLSALSIKDGLPIKVALSTSIVPTVNMPFDLTYSVSSRRDADNITAKLVVPKGAFLISGDIEFSGDLKAGETKSSTIRLAFKEVGRWTIYASAHQTNHLGNVMAADVNAMYIDVGTISSTIGWQPEPIKVQQVGLGEEQYKINNFSEEPQFFPNLEGRPIPAVTVDGKLLDIVEHHSITVTGTWRYYTSDPTQPEKDYRNVLDPFTFVSVPARNFLVELCNINGNTLGWDYTNESGEFSVPGIDPANGVKTRLYACTNYSGDELRVVFQGNSLSGLQDVWTTGFTATYNFPDDGQIHFMGAFEIPRAADGDGAFWIKDDLDRAYLLPGAAPWPGPCTVRWTENSAEGTQYNWGGQVYIDGPNVASSDIIIHEYAHNALFNKYGYVIPLDYGPGGHSIPRAENKPVAWVEGWAEFYPFVVNGNPSWTYADGSEIDVENQTWETPGWDDGDMVEGRVAGALWDLYDSANEGLDQFSAPFSTFWNTFCPIQVLNKTKWIPFRNIGIG